MLRKAHGACLVLIVVGGCFGDASFGRSSIPASTEPCTSDADCDDTGGGCTRGACHDGECLQVSVPAGAPLEDDQQTVGDCVVLVCDGQGTQLKESDPTDAMDDGNPCTLEGCSPDGPVATPVPEGTECGFRACCDATGQCTGFCLSHEDCGPPEGSPCEMRACNDCGQCVSEFVAQGTPAADDVAGDCRIVVCDGYGGWFEADDYGDIPFDDGDMCTIEECVERRGQAVPSYTPVCP